MGRYSMFLVGRINITKITILPNVFPCASNGKESACNTGDLSSIPGWVRTPGEGNGNPLQYFCLENPRGGGAWWASDYGVAQSRTRLKRLSSSNEDQMC